MPDVGAASFFDTEPSASDAQLILWAFSPRSKRTRMVQTQQDAVRMTHTPVSDRTAMIAGMAPRLDPETYLFCTLNDDELVRRAAPRALCVFVEEEGTSLIIGADAAARLGLTGSDPMRRITLEVFSSLEGFGLTAAVAGVLSENQIACNMVAAFHHDHVFVPAGKADQALAILLDLQQRAAQA